MRRPVVDVDTGGVSASTLDNGMGTNGGNGGESGTFCASEFLAAPSSCTVVGFVDVLRPGFLCEVNVLLGLVWPRFCPVPAAASAGISTQSGCDICGSSTTSEPSEFPLCRRCSDTGAGVGHISPSNIGTEGSGAGCTTEAVEASSGVDGGGNEFFLAVLALSLLRGGGEKSSGGGDEQSE